MYQTGHLVVSLLSCGGDTIGSMSSKNNPPDTKDDDNDKKDSACESTKKLVHGTPPRRKIIRAKRPPMSKTGFKTPTAPVSASDSPPAEGESEDAKSELEFKSNSL